MIFGASPRRIREEDLGTSFREVHFSTWWTIQVYYQQSGAHYSFMIKSRNLAQILWRHHSMITRTNAARDEPLRSGISPIFRLSQ